ncbi:hypothetical protein ACFYYS_19475 [Streptomyces sp. NPDC002120]|uniref:hypothetical protein n=1 Tax=Streptomyces sp. NPDC002120 TaxID=3364631 RepID=UPI0036A8C872
MTEYPNFSAMLTRLLDHRGVGVPEPADHAGVTAAEIRGVLEGETPGEGLLRRLATALGLHAADLFILAGREVPDDLAPLDAAATPWTAYTVMDAVHLPAAGRSELLRFIRALPQEKRRSHFVPKESEPVADGPGGSLVRMFWYRNLSRSGLAHAMAVVTPSYLSAATYGMIGEGRAELTPRLVTDFATLLGIEAHELAAVTGVLLPKPPGPPAPEAVDAAAVLWELRRLSAPQAEHVAELAKSMRGDSPVEYRINAPGW